MDHIEPATHKGPIVNGYLIQKQPDKSWRIYDSRGDYTLHECKSLGQAVMVARRHRESQRGVRDVTKFPFSLEEFKALSPEERFAAMSKHRADTGRHLDDLDDVEQTEGMLEDRERS